MNKNILTNLIISDTIKLLNKIKIAPRDEILGIYEVDDRLKVKVFKTTIIGSRKEYNEKLNIQ